MYVPQASPRSMTQPPMHGDPVAAVGPADAVHRSKTARGLARESEGARGREIDGRLHGRERLDVILELGLVAVEWGEGIAVIGRAIAHSRHEALVQRAVRPLDDGYPQGQHRAVERAGNVRDLVMNAVRKRRAVADDERRSPSVRAEDVPEPAAAPLSIRGGSGELIVLARHDGETGPVRSRIPDGPRKAELERIGVRFGQCAIERFLEIGDESSL